MAERPKARRRPAPDANDSSRSGRARRPGRGAQRAAERRYRDELLQAVSAEIEPVPITGTYRLALFGVAAAMILLPVGYLAFVALACFGIYWHAVNDVWMASVSVWGFLFYVFPLLAGPVVVLFLVKPLFADPLASQRPRAIRREAQPFLYEYVETLCESLGAPAPKSIRVNCDVNASASFRRGLVSLFSGDLTLTLGLPLVHGLTARQLSGVLAHEFGHFAQGTGMRLSFFIRHINFWFLRAVFERDAWDEWMYRWSDGSSARGLLIWGIRIAVFVARAILWCFMQIGNMISCYLCRQMEFDADRYMTRLVGSQSFSPTHRRIEALSIAEQFANRDLSNFYEEGRLVDDLPRLIAANVDQITPELQKAIREHEKAQKTGLFDTHPTSQERLENSAEEGTDGVFQVSEKLEKLRAAVLFQDVAKVCRWASLQFYREVLGPELNPDTLHSVDEMLDRRYAEIAAEKSLHRYFQVQMPAFYPFPIAGADDSEIEDPKSVARAIRQSRKEMLDELDVYTDMTERFEHAEWSQTESAAALTLLDAGVPIRGKDFGMQDSSRKTAKFRHRNSQKGTEHLAAMMLTFEESAGNRLAQSLRLLSLDDCAENIEDGQDLRDEIQELLPHARLMSRLVGELPTLRILCHRMIVLLHHMGGQEENPDFVETLFETFEKVHGRLESLYRSIGLNPYPFDHIEEHMTLRDFVLPEVPDPRDLGGMLHVSQAAVERLVTIQMRLFARLAFAAEKVEEFIGLEPLPDPEEAQQKKKKSARRESGRRRPRAERT